MPPMIGPFRPTATLTPLVWALARRKNASGSLLTGFMADVFIPESHKTKEPICSPRLGCALQEWDKETERLTIGPKSRQQTSIVVPLPMLRLYDPS